jgi:hypothetical protein
VAAATARRRLAVELAAFLADSAAQRLRLQQGLELAYHPVLAEQAVVADTLGWERVFRDVMQGARMPWGARVPGWREVEYRLPRALDQVLLGGWPLDATLHEAARGVDRILAETAP